jgi:hypothetical protein
VGDFKVPISVGQIRPATKEEIVDDVLATVLDITVKAWPRLCQSKKVSPRAKEDDITDCLRWEMDAERKRRDPQPQLLFLREVQRDDPQKRFPTGLIDVYVAYSLEDSDKYIALECKKVTDRHNRRARFYVQNGVCRFSSGKYSPGHPYGAMIAFVTRGTAEAAAKLVGNKVVTFDKDATKLRTTWGWQAEQQFGQIPNLYSTKHGQAKSQNTIMLLHLFLSFPAQN